MFQGLPMCHLLCPCCLCTPGCFAAKESIRELRLAFCTLSSVPHRCFLHSLRCSSKVKPHKRKKALAQRLSFGITAVTS